MFADLPHRQSVMRLRTSSILPFEERTGTPPLTHIGPLSLTPLSSTNWIEGLKRGSIGFPVAFSHNTNRPDGHMAVICFAILLAFGSSDASVNAQIPPAR